MSQKCAAPEKAAHTKEEWLSFMEDCIRKRSQPFVFVVGVPMGERSEQAALRRMLQGTDHIH